MIPGDSTRHRLVRAAAEVFAEHGYHGAAVRDICNHARVNPGAVSYHFGGKRQLYRAVLRQATERLSAPALLANDDEQPGQAFTGSIIVAMRLLLHRLDEDPVPARLILRDLADGGSVAVEALAPALASALDLLRSETAQDDTPLGTSAVRTMLLELAAPLFLLTAGWPVLSRALELEQTDKARLLDVLLERTLRRQRQELA